MRPMSTDLALVPKTPEITNSDKSQQDRRKGKGFTFVLSDSTLHLQVFRNIVW